MNFLKSKKAILGLDTVKQVTLALLGLAVIGVAVLIVLDALEDSTSDTAVSGNITLITNNVTSGLTTFFGNIPTFFTLLAVVVIILIISIVVVAVGRFGGTAETGL